MVPLDQPPKAYLDEHCLFLLWPREKIWKFVKMCKLANEMCFYVKVNQAKKDSCKYVKKCYIL